MCIVWYKWCRTSKYGVVMKDIVGTGMPRILVGVDYHQSFKVTVNL